MSGVLLAALLSTTMSPAISAAAPGQAVITPVAEVDLAEFAARAEQWSEARAEWIEESGERARELAADARAAEAEQLAEQEAARQAEEARQAAAEAARLEAARQAATTTTTTTTTTAAPTTTTTVAPATTAPAAPAEPGAGEPTAEQWAALRRCESSGNYGIVSADGRFRGAYQFSQATWDWVAGFANPALIGVDPAQAAPADQDAQALGLWRVRGWSPWPTCGRGL